jgi:hypothetical protein
MTSRRALLKAGTGFAAGAAVAALPPNAAVVQSQDSDAATLEHLLRADPNTRRILLKGGTIISMDPTVGDFAQGDVLIEGRKFLRSDAISTPRITGSVKPRAPKSAILPPMLSSSSAPAQPMK